MSSHSFFRSFVVIGLLVAAAGLSASPAAGELISYSLVKSFPANELKALFKKNHIPKIVLPVRRGLNVYQVVYTTTYADSFTVIKASGLLYVPMNTVNALPIMTYNHGTEICREFACDFTEERLICLAFATDGYIVLTPDYVGLGKGEKTQLFINAYVESHATVDMIIAVKKLLPQFNVRTSQQLFITGYSQGGHASMATTRLLQQEYSQQLPVTASAPMSGPYDIEGTVYGGRNKKYEYPVFLFLLLQSYFESKGNYYDMKNVLNPPYDTLIPPLLDGNTNIDDIDKLLPDTISKTIKKTFYDAFENDPESDFRRYLKSNNVYDWKPEMPMQLSYCNADEEVPYHNSIEAFETMKNNGSTTVQLWDSGKKFGHENCALFAVIYTKWFFDGFRHGHPGNHGPAFKRMLLNIGKLTVKPN